MNDYEGSSIFTHDGSELAIKGNVLSSATGDDATNYDGHVVTGISTAKVEEKNDKRFFYDFDDNFQFFRQNSIKKHIFFVRNSKIFLLGSSGNLDVGAGKTGGYGGIILQRSCWRKNS